MKAVVSAPAIGGLLDVAIAIADEQGKLLDQLKAALLAKDQKRAISVATKLVGIDEQIH